MPRSLPLRRSLAAALLLPLAVAGPARADLIAYEAFAYTPGSNLNGSNGGTGWAGAWAAGGSNASVSDHLTVSDSSLAAAGLATSGGRATAGSQSQIAGLTRFFDGDVLGAGGTTSYISVLLRPEGTLGAGQFNGFFGLVLESALDGPEVFVGKPGSAANAPWAIEQRGGSNTAFSNFIPQVGRTDLLVLKAEWGLGEPGGQAFDRLSLFINPTAGEPEPMFAHAITTAIDTNRVTGLTLASTGAFSVDELRVGTTFADVAPAPVPEPATAALLALGLLAVPVARRRRSAAR